MVGGRRGITWLLPFVAVDITFGLALAVSHGLLDGCPNLAPTCVVRGGACSLLTVCGNSWQQGPAIALIGGAIGLIPALIAAAVLDLGWPKGRRPGPTQRAATEAMSVMLGGGLASFGLLVMPAGTWIYAVLAAALAVVPVSLLGPRLQSPG